jgi:transcriptional regulator with XRE-family HTH domain
MNLTQAEVALYFGCNVQAVARWEKGKNEVNGAADRLLRFLYLSSRCTNVSPEDIIRRISELDTKQNTRQVFEETQDGWKTAA